MLCDHPELSYWPLKKPDRQTNGQQKNDERMDDNDKGAFNIDSITNIGANADKIFVKKKLT